MSELDRFPAPLKEALATHELLRRLGFSSDQIFMHRNPPPLEDIVVVLKHQGKQCAITLGKLVGPWEEDWSRLVELYNTHVITEAEFQAWYDQSWVRMHAPEILLVLGQKGITPPYGVN